MRPATRPQLRSIVRWETVILLVMLSYYLPQTSEVHGASHSETIVDGITFAISADNVYKGELLDVTLSVAGTWNSFYTTKPSLTEQLDLCMTAIVGVELIVFRISTLVVTI